MIAELEQCSCGMLFQLPMLNDESYGEHIQNRIHEHALLVGSCGPCFAGLCANCEQNRGSRSWRCRCDHRMRLSIADEGRAHEIAVTWSQWLGNGRPSEAMAR